MNRERGSSILIVSLAIRASDQVPLVLTEMDSMSLPVDTAARLATHDAGSASENPRPIATSRPLLSSASGSKSNLTSSIQALKDLALKGSPTASAGIADEPLATAYEKRIQTLQDSLKDRDQVVQMLTQRLEQAADQLDRMQRTGGGRGGAVAAGVPSELIENQQTMSEQMTQLLGQWEELQASAVLGRIESRLSELHELVASGAVPAANTSAIHSIPAARLKDNTREREPVREPLKEPVREKEPVNPPTNRVVGNSVFSDILSADPTKVGWEAIKAAMMDNASLNTAPAKKPEPVAEAPVMASSPPEPVVEEPIAPPPLPEPPPPVDFDIADHAMLIEAIRSRDEFISTLLRRLSAPDVSTDFPDWDKLNYVPEDLHRELLSLRNRLQEKLRTAEVDLSLQRARLAREEAKLSIKAEHLSRQMKQLGLSPEEPGSQVGGTRALSEGSNATQGRRWLQFLQRSNGNGSGTDER